MKTDLEIQKDVMEELKWQPSINSNEIGVSVKNGVVTLSGTVDSYSKKVSAETAAKNVGGVKVVAEEIEVKIFPSSKKTDQEIAEAILNTLKWSSPVQQGKIKVEVEKGWVTLDGEVDWEFQRSSAQTLVENLTGVVNVSNKIKIKPAVTASDIKKKISAAFHRSATVDSGKIIIDIQGNKVTLTGKVSSYAEKKEAENSVWSAPGVDRVVNELEVDFGLIRS